MPQFVLKICFGYLEQFKTTWYHLPLKLAKSFHSSSKKIRDNYEYIKYSGDVLTRSTHHNNTLHCKIKFQ